MTELAVSAPGDIKPRGEKLIELPEPQADGSKIVVRIRQSYASDIWAESGGLQALAEVPNKSKDGQKRKLVGDEADKVLEKIAAYGILAPQFCFGERIAGFAFWGDLSIANRLTVVNEIMAYAGIKFADPKAEGQDGAASRLATFPDGNASGLAGGGGTSATVPVDGRSAAHGRGPRKRVARSGKGPRAVGPSRSAAA